VTRTIMDGSAATGASVASGPTVSTIPSVLLTLGVLLAGAALIPRPTFPSGRFAVAAACHLVPVASVVLTPTEPLAACVRGSINYVYAYSIVALGFGLAHGAAQLPVPRILFSATCLCLLHFAVLITCYLRTAEPAALTAVAPAITIAFMFGTLLAACLRLCFANHDTWSKKVSVLESRRSKLMAEHLAVLRQDKKMIDYLNVVVAEKKQVEDANSLLEYDKRRLEYDLAIAMSRLAKYENVSSSTSLQSATSEPSPPRSPELRSLSSSDDERFGESIDSASVRSPRQNWPLLPRATMNIPVLVRPPGTLMDAEADDDLQLVADRAAFQARRFGRIVRVLLRRGGLQPQVRFSTLPNDVFEMLMERVVVSERNRLVECLELHDV